MSRGGAAWLVAVAVLVAVFVAVLVTVTVGAGVGGIVEGGGVVANDGPVGVVDRTAGLPVTWALHPQAITMHAAAAAIPAQRG